jgi:hypothetical protein
MRLESPVAENDKSRFQKERRKEGKILTAISIGASKSYYFTTDTTVKFPDNTFHITVLRE